MTSRRLSAILAALGLTVALGATGCAPQREVRKPESMATNTASPEQVESLRAGLGSLPGVTGVELEYQQAPKFYEPTWEATITAKGVDKAGLVALLDKAYRTMWLAPGIPYGDPTFTITDGAGTEVGAADLGFNGTPIWTDLDKRYGPRPSIDAK